MNRWMLATLIGAIAIVSTLDAARANADVDSSSTISQAESFPASAPSEADPITQVWTLIRQAQQATSPAQATDYLDQADELATTVQDATRRQQLWSAIAIRYAALGNMEQAIALTSKLDYQTYAPEYCCTPLRTEAEMAIAREYAKAGQIDQAVQFVNTIEPEFSRNQALAALIEQLAQQEELDRAIALVSQINNDSYQTARSQHNIIRGYILNQQFVEGLRYSQTMTNEGDEQSGAQFNLVQGAVRAGDYAIAQQIAQNISSPPSKLEALRITALAYAGIGDMDAARELLDQGYAQLQSIPDNQSFSYWVRNYAEIGDYERAIQIADQLTMRYDQAESYIFIGQVMAQYDQFEEAFKLAQRVEDYELQVLADYEDPKILLLNAIVQKAAAAGEYDFAVQVARSYGPVNKRVQALQTVAEEATIANQKERAIATLWEAFELTKTIDVVGYHVDRHMYLQSSNAPLLISIANGFITLDETDRAIAALDLAVQSAQSFETDNYYDTSAGELLQWFDIANAYIQLNQIEKAQSVLNNATELANSTEDVGLRIQRLGQISQVYARMEQPEKAQAILDQALPLIAGLADGPQKLGGISALAEAYALLGNEQQTRAIAAQVLQASQAIQEPYQQSMLLSQVALSLAASPDPSLSLQLANSITEEVSRAQALADIAAKYMDADRSEQAQRVTEQLVDSAEHTWDSIQRDSLLSNLIYNRYAAPSSAMSSWQYEFARFLNAAVQDPKAQAANAFTIALGEARQGNMQAAQASITSGLESLANVSDRALRAETLWMSLEEMIRAGEPEVAAMLVSGFEDPQTRIAVLRQLAQSAVRRGDVTEANTLIEQARTEAEAIADLPSRLQVLNSIDSQKSNWVSSLNYSIPL